MFRSWCVSPGAVYESPTPTGSRARAALNLAGASRANHRVFVSMVLESGPSPGSTSKYRPDGAADGSRRAYRVARSGCTRGRNRRILYESPEECEPSSTSRPPSGETPSRRAPSEGGGGAATPGGRGPAGFGGSRGRSRRGAPALVRARSRGGGFARSLRRRLARKVHVRHLFEILLHGLHLLPKSLQLVVPAGRSILFAAHALAAVVASRHRHSSPEAARVVWPACDLHEVLDVGDESGERRPIENPPMRTQTRLRTRGACVEPPA